MRIDEVLESEPYLFLLKMINLAIKESGITVDDNKIIGVLSSLDYYDSKEEKISCLIRSIIKNHGFTNGNKRTAAAFYVMMCRHMNYTPPFTNQQFVDVFIDIASNSYSVETISSKLFPK